MANTCEESVLPLRRIFGYVIAGAAGRGIGAAARPAIHGTALTLAGDPTLADARTNTFSWRQLAWRAMRCRHDVVCGPERATGGGRLTTADRGALPDHGGAALMPAAQPGTVRRVSFKDASWRHPGRQAGSHSAAMGRANYEEYVLPALTGLFKDARRERYGDDRQAHAAGTLSTWPRTVRTSRPGRIDAPILQPGPEDTAPAPAEPAGWLLEMTRPLHKADSQLAPLSFLCP